MFPFVIKHVYQLILFVSQFCCFFFLVFWTQRHKHPLWYFEYHIACLSSTSSARMLYSCTCMLNIYHTNGSVLDDFQLKSGSQNPSDVWDLALLWRVLPVAPQHFAESLAIHWSHPPSLSSPTRARRSCISHRTVPHISSCKSPCCSTVLRRTLSYTLVAPSPVPTGLSCISHHSVPNFVVGTTIPSYARRQ